MIGKRLGNRYEVLALIGSGGMSLVYQAKDIYLDRIVAVKVLREQFTSDTEFIRRFRREAQAAASLSHPNIVNIYDVGQDGGNYYIVMEMIRGKTLKEFIDIQGPLAVNVAIDIAKQICDALEHAHENAIVHRDVKPHNILLTTGNRVKVTDFGIARAISTATVTHTRSIVGSVHYFSPEQAKGELSGVKSDLYSLGIVIYEMVTGKVPFEGDSPIAIALKQIQSEPLPPSSHNPSIPQSLEKIILRAMSKDPEKRHENARKLRMDLMEVLLKKPLMQPLLPKESNMPKENYVKKPLAVSDDTLVFDDDGNILANTATVQENKSFKQEQGVEKTKRKIKPIGWILIGLLILFIIIGIASGLGKIFIRQEVVIPDLRNMPVEEAQRLLKSQDLIMTVKNSVFHREVPKDHIISQQPSADVTIKTGRAIEVVVSKGPALVVVPNLVGSPRLIAEVNISNARLTIGEIDEDFSSQYPIGQVMNQAPKAFEEVLENSQIDLVISKGPEPQNISMPTLVGMELKEATEELIEAGLILGEISRKESQLYPENFVIEQNPNAGQEIIQGSTIDLTLSSGPGPIARQERVNLQVNESGQIKVSVQDTAGTRVTYNQPHQKGDVFATVVNYYGEGVITVYKDEVMVNEKIVPSNQ